MINFNSFHINILSVFISLIIFLLLISIINIPKNENKKNENKKLEYTLNISVSINNVKNEVLNHKINKEQITKWKIEINKLSLKADIIELDENTPNNYSVGHIKQTSILGNNIALIAYNFGTDKNYFANLKELSVGDKIIYTVNDKKFNYKVISNKIIEKNSLEEILKDNNKNERLLKLITYVKDIDNKLRYVLSKRDN